MASMISKISPIPCYASKAPKKTSLQILTPNSVNWITSFSVNNTKRLDISRVYASSSYTPLKHSDNQTSEYLLTAHEQNIERQRNTLRAIGDENPFESLEMIDAIQHLGIDHLFRYDIEKILGKLYKKCSLYEYYGRNRREVSLCFRLLRQEGYPVPASTFNDFKDKDGQFKEDLKQNTEDLVELIEASHLSIQGEEILDQARDFADNCLRELSLSRENREAQPILNMLDRPNRKYFPKQMAEKFINMSVTGENEWLRCLQQVAKIDLDKVKAMHQQELSQTIRWWRELGLAEKLTKARDKPMTWYAWSMSILEDLSLSEQRLDLVKPISFIYIIDDIFDVYGGIDELTIFTEVVDRWDYEGLEELPKHMKVCFEGLDMITTEISEKVYRSHGWNPIDSLRKAWANLFKAFLVEAKWFASGYIPGTVEYLKNGIMSSSVNVVMLHVFFLLGEDITQEKVEYINNNPRIISSAATIVRLWDDLGGAKDENQDGYDGSYLECYKKQHQGSTTEEARKHVSQMISDAWKCLNEECLFPRPFSRSFTEACLNVAGMVPLMYGYDDSHDLLELKDYMKSLMLEN